MPRDFMGRGSTISPIWRRSILALILIFAIASVVTFTPYRISRTSENARRGDTLRAAIEGWKASLGEELKLVRYDKIRNF
jgi:hypothetical protein